MNIPNIITMARFFLIPVAVVLIYFDMMLSALIVYTAACATDLLDGYIARKKNLVTNEGKLLDPLADKLMAVFAVTAFTVAGVLPVFILIVLLVKELMMIAGGILLYFKNVVVPSNTFGKIAAFAFNVSVGLTFLYKCVSPWHIYFMCFALALSLVALGQYAYLNMFKKMKNK